MKFRKGARVTARWLRSAILAAVFFLAALMSAQVPQSAPSPRPASRLTVDSIIRLSQAHVSDDLLIRRIRRQNQPFDLSSEDLIKLRKANVSDAVVAAMIDPAGTAPSRAELTRSPAPAPAQPAPAPVIQACDGSAGNAQTQQGSADAPKRGALGGLLDGARSAIQQSGSWHRGKNPIDTCGLRNILPQYDSGKPLSQQFPHVALAVLKSPPNWADQYLRPVTGRGTGGVFEGCWTLQATVWSDELTSKIVGPFDWCSPQDAEIQLGPMIAQFNFPPPMERSSGYLTGIERTTGPRPPSTLAPNDAATQDLIAKNNRRRASFDLSSDGVTAFALMFANLRKGMGETFQTNDFRIWIVSIQ